VHRTTTRTGRGPRPTRTPLLALLVLLVLLVACTSDGDGGGTPADPGAPAALDDGTAADDEGTDTADTEDADAEDGPDAPQPIRSAEGLHEQLRLRFGTDELPEEHEPGTTDWRDREAPADVAETYDTPGELAFALAAALDAEALGEDLWETTTRVLHDQSDADQAYVAVLSWGFADDAVVGRDVRMTITRTDGGWAPGGVEERHHCLRGVDDDVCV
jgi:hypothetical protein